MKASPQLITLPPGAPALGDIETVQQYIGPVFSRTVAYLLMSSGDIASVLVGLPGKRGKRLMVMQSVVDYLNRRSVQTAPPNVLPAKTAREAATE